MLLSDKLTRHPTTGGVSHELCLMCDDLAATVADVRRKGVAFIDAPSEHDWCTVTFLKVPGGGTLTLYEPRHERPLAA